MTVRRFALLFSLVLVFALPASAQAGGRVASATGAKDVDGETLYVDVVVAVPPGQTDRQATDQALSEQGAHRRKKPPWAGGGGGGGGGTEQYFYTGLVWSPPSVVQNYNPASQPFDAKGALTNTHADWSNLPNSTYNISYGADTTRCPSLVQECPGPQVKDPYNDVGWLALGGNTLGVTWYTTSAPEADMALNTRFTWKNTCGTSGTGYDVETVFLHENGHVAGLDHVNRSDSVMYPSYQSPRCTLFDYDKRAIANLY
jgi:Matrixin